MGENANVWEEERGDDCLSTIFGLKVALPSSPVVLASADVSMVIKARWCRQYHQADYSPIALVNLKARCSFLWWLMDRAGPVTSLLNAPALYGFVGCSRRAGPTFAGAGPLTPADPRGSWPTQQGHIRHSRLATPPTTTDQHRFHNVSYLLHLLWFKSHCLEFITTDCQFLILGNIQAYHWLCGFLHLSTIQLVSQLVSEVYFSLFLF